MDASCKIQGSIHMFRLVNNMCPGKWVHITIQSSAFFFLFKSHISSNTDILFDLSHKHKSIKSYEINSLLSSIHI